MTVVHNKPLDTYRAAISKAKAIEDRRIARNNKKLFKKPKRFRSPKDMEAYLQAIEDRKRLGIKLAPRDKKFKGLYHRSTKHVNVSLTSFDVKERNRKKLLSKLAENKARARKKEIDDLGGSKTRTYSSKD